MPKTLKIWSKVSPVQSSSPVQWSSPANRYTHVFNLFFSLVLLCVLCISTVLVVLLVVIAVFVCVCVNYYNMYMYSV